MPVTAEHDFDRASSARGSHGRGCIMKIESADFVGQKLRWAALRRVAYEWIALHGSGLQIPEIPAAFFDSITWVLFRTTPAVTEVGVVWEAGRSV